MVKWKTHTLDKAHGKTLELDTILSGILSPTTLGLLSEEEKEKNEYNYSYLRANRIFKKMKHSATMSLFKMIGIIHKKCKRHVMRNHTRIKIKRRK